MKIGPEKKTNRLSLSPPHTHKTSPPGNKLNKTNSNNVVPNNGNMSMPCNNLNSNLGGQPMGGQANMNSGILMNGSIINSSSISNSPINSSINSSASSTPNLNTTSSGNLSNSNAGNLNSMNCKMQPPLNSNNNMNSNPNMVGNLPGNGMANAQMINMSNLNSMNMNSNPNMVGGPPNSAPLPNNLNSLNANAKNSNKFDSQYVQSNLVYVFGTQLANEAAEAVVNQKADTMISYHAGLSRTQKFLDENLLKNQPPPQQLPNWPGGNKRNKQSPCSMNGQPPNNPNNPNSQNNSMSPYAYRPPSNSSVVSNASYRPGPSPGIPNDLNNWNPSGNPEMTNNLGWQSPQHPNSANSSNFVGNPNMRPSMNSNQMMPNNGSGGCFFSLLLALPFRRASRACFTIQISSLLPFIFSFYSFVHSFFAFLRSFFVYSIACVSFLRTPLSSLLKLEIETVRFVFACLL